MVFFVASWFMQSFQGEFQRESGKLQLFIFASAIPAMIGYLVFDAIYKKRKKIESSVLSVLAYTTMGLIILAELFFFFVIFLGGGFMGLGFN